MTPLYDASGDVRAWVHESGIIYDLSGSARAFLVKSEVYSFSGEHLGRFVSGYLRDHAGDAVGWVPGATGGPLLPIGSIPPIPPIPSIPPIPPVPSIPPIPSIDSLAWSA